MRHQVQCFSYRSPFAFSLSLILLFLLHTPAHAAFETQYIEHFDGTVKDPTTWASYNGSGISQDDALIFNTLDRYSEYTTRLATIGVGGYAQVQVTISDTIGDPLYIQRVMLGLSTHSAPLDKPMAFNSRAVAVELRSSGDFAFAAAYRLRIGDGTGFKLSQPTQLDQTYYLRLDVLSSTSIKYSISDAQMNLLGSTSRTLDDLPTRYFVTLHSAGVVARFDNLELGGNVAIPEPSAALLSLVLPTLLLRPRRHHARAL